VEESMFCSEKLKRILTTKEHKGIHEGAQRKNITTKDTKEYTKVHKGKR